MNSVWHGCNDRSMYEPTNTQPLFSFINISTARPGQEIVVWLLRYRLEMVDNVWCWVTSRTRTEYNLETVEDM